MAGARGALTGDAGPRVGWFAGGAGTAASPYWIDNCAALQAMNSYRTSQFVIMNDIDCAGYDNTGGAGFLPIGDQTVPFGGVLLGNGYTIRNLRINRPSSQYVGLVGFASSATIRDLAISDSTIVGGNYTGAFLGYSNNVSLVERVFTTSTVFVAGQLGVGGLVGHPGAGTVRDAYVRGTTVTGSGSVGLLTGISFAQTIVRNAYAVGTLANATGNSTGTFTGVLLDCTVAGTTCGGSNKTTTELQTLATYQAADPTWNFSSTWGFRWPRPSYPCLRWEAGCEAPCRWNDTTCDNWDDNCNGTKDEGFASTATSCGIGPCLRTGSMVCQAGAVVDTCVPGTGALADASCDNVDNDCNGDKDEDFLSTASPCGLNECASVGATRCVSGTIVSTCVAKTPISTAEIYCDGLDEDCDGAVDDDSICTSGARPTWVNGTIAQASGVESPYSVVVSWSGATDSVGIAGYRFYVNGLLWTHVVDLGNNTAEIQGLTPPPGNDPNAVPPPNVYQITVQAVNTRGNVSTNGPSLGASVAWVPSLGSLAPALPTTRVPTFEDRYSFMYGTNGPQRGADVSAIDPLRAGLVTGRVVDRNGDGIPGVLVSVREHPEFGRTYTRGDGTYAFVANGGGSMTIQFAQAAFLPSERTVEMDWSRGLLVDTVAMIGLDPRATAVNPASSTATVVQGSVVNEPGLAIPNRRATVVFPRSFQAWTGEGSATTPLNNLTVRATEYTATAQGAAALPGSMPTQISVDYAVELSVDEAINAPTVNFDTPVHIMVPNIYGFAVGTRVPVGSYDRQRHAWVASENGLVVRVCTPSSGGLLMLDMNGLDGCDTEDVDLMHAFDLDDQKRSELVARNAFQVDDTLWIARVKHFTPYDLNWAGGISPNAESPEDPVVDDAADPICESLTCGSIIRNHSRAVAEEFPVPGTSMSLHYQSDRTRGATDLYRIRFPMTKYHPNWRRGSGDPEYINTTTTIVLAGKSFRFVNTMETGGDVSLAGGVLFRTFEWDGKDAMDRDARGPERAQITVCMNYVRNFRTARGSSSGGGSAAARLIMLLYAPTFGLASGSLPIGAPQGRWGGGVGLASYSTCKTSEAVMGTRIAEPLSTGLGGLTLDVHHQYAPGVDRVLRGDGETTRTDAVNTITTVLGRPSAQTTAYTEDQLIQAEDAGTPKTAAELSISGSPAWTVGPDGTIYFKLRTDGTRIFRVDGDGKIRLFAGVRSSAAYNETLTDMLATARAIDGARLSESTYNLHFGQDGYLYFSDYVALGANRGVRRIRNGWVEPVAGFGAANPSNPLPSSKPNATDAQIRDGAAAVASVGSPNLTGAVFANIGSIRVHSDGTVFVHDVGTNRIRRVGTNGVITTVVGGTCEPSIHTGCQSDNTATTTCAPTVDSCYGEIQAGGPGRAHLGANGGFTLTSRGTIVMFVAGTLYEFGEDGRWIAMGGGSSTPVASTQGISNGTLLSDIRLPSGTTAPVERLAGGDYVFGYVNRVYRVWADRRVTRVAGISTAATAPTYPRSVAERVQLPRTFGLAAGADGTVFLNDGYHFHQLAMSGMRDALCPLVNSPAPAPGETDEVFTLASPDGLVNRFNAAGTHLRTTAASTDAAVRSFQYDVDGRLWKIIEPVGVTTIEHISDTWVTITSPFGQVTNLYDQNPRDGWTDRITYDNDPNPGAVTQLGPWTTTGLLQGIAGRDAVNHEFQYDDHGLLQLDRRYDSVNNQVQTLAGVVPVRMTCTVGSTDARCDALRWSTVPARIIHRTVTRTSADRPTKYESALTETGVHYTRITRPNGNVSRVWENEEHEIRTESPDGTLTTVLQEPHPVYSWYAPYASSTTVVTPGGKSIQLLQQVTVTPTSETRTYTIGTRSSSSVLAWTGLQASPTTATLTVTSPTTRQTVVTFDSQWRATTIAYPGMQPISLGYDSRSRVTSRRIGDAAGGRQTSYRYESTLDTDTISSGPPEETESWGWGTALGGAAAQPGATDHVLTQIAWDALVEASRMRDSGGNVTTVAYNAGGRPRDVTPPGRDAHSFTYSAFGSTASYTAPAATVGGSTSVTTTTYQGDGELDTMTLPESRTVRATVNGTSRLTTALDVSGWGPPVANVTLARRITPTYDAQGVLSGLRAPTFNAAIPTLVGTQALIFRRDASVPTSETWDGAVTGTVTRLYYGNNDLRLKGFVIASGTQEAASTTTPEISFSYDADSALTSIGGTRLGTFTETLSRDPRTGLPSGTQIGSVTTTMGWYPTGSSPSTGLSFGLPSSQGATWTGGDLSWTYEFDGVGRMTTRVETRGTNVGTYVYHYDTSGRLDKVTRNGFVVEQYGYDANGNRTSVLIGGATVVPTYDRQDRLTNYNGQTFSYNGAGQMTARTVPGVGTTNYSYDALGNLTRVVLPGGQAIDYSIDARGRRIGRTYRTSVTATTAASRRSWLYQDGLEPIAELDSTGAVAAVFVYGSMAHTPDLVIRGGVVYRVISDHVGTVRRVVNAQTGALMQSFDYDAFGQITYQWYGNGGDADLQPFRFAGGLFDRDTGLTRFGARDYDASIGRWTAKDPLRFGGGSANLYEYVSSNPVCFVDPTGRNPALVILGGGVAGLAGYVSYQLAVGGSLTLGGAVGSFVGGAVGTAVTPFVTPIGGAIVGGIAGGLTDRLVDSLWNDHEREVARHRARDHFAGNASGIDMDGSACTPEAAEREADVNMHLDEDIGDRLRPIEVSHEHSQPSFTGNGTFGYSW